VVAGGHVQAIAEFGVISEKDVSDLFFADDGTATHDTPQ
jgi:hypothetical protein